MFHQYHHIKARHKDCILFFRLGDFYEMFFEDAMTASRELNLVLTRRGRGTACEAPMCGIPYHAAEGYIARLIRAGHKVAICEQVEDPAGAKGIVKRDVVRIVTSGTFLDEETSEARYLLALTFHGRTVGAAFTDPTSGTIQVAQYPNDRSVIDLVGRLAVRECVFAEGQRSLVTTLFRHPFLRTRGITLSPREDREFDPSVAHQTLCDHFHLPNLRGFGIEDLPAATAAAGALLAYLRDMNKQPLRHIDRIQRYTEDVFVHLPPSAARGLELESLFRVLDHTVTALGRRRLHFWTYHPLRRPAEILQRQAAVTRLKTDPSLLNEIREVLRKVPDIEKAVSRISCGYRHPKAVLAVRNGLQILPRLMEICRSVAGQNRFFTIPDVPDLRQRLAEAIDPEMPIGHWEGRCIKPGYDPELDRLRDLQANGRQWLKTYQEQEARRTGIPSLKIGFNKVFGYYIEVTKPHLKSVPSDYLRKQTLTNAERFITGPLKEFEEDMLTAQEKAVRIEDGILQALREEILAQAPALHRTAAALGTLDALGSLARTAARSRTVAPEINEGDLIDIRAGRHPVVEAATEPFVPNDTLMDGGPNRLLLLTGPNMAGKSTYIRQTALLVILAQMGAHIPADRAVIGVADKIFTRIGAHDDIAKGQSTFMVEMNETAEILNNLTPRSLIVLDEIGRGTGTHDGLSLAWALAEHFRASGARVLFATHFHELTALAERIEGVKNYNVAVKEWEDEIIFLHKIVEGGTDDSYGIYVAKLAGIPESVIRRARALLTRLEWQGPIEPDPPKKDAAQPDLFTAALDPKTETVKQRLSEIDINTLTPIEALNRLQELKDILSVSDTAPTISRED